MNNINVKQAVNKAYTGLQLSKAKKQEFEMLYIHDNSMYMFNVNYNTRGYDAIKLHDIENTSGISYAYTAKSAKALLNKDNNTFNDTAINGLPCKALDIDEDIIDNVLLPQFTEWSSTATSLSADALLKSLRCIAYVVLTRRNDHRSYLDGVYCDSKNHNLVTTDGHRLACVPNDLGIDGLLTLPAVKTLLGLLPLCGKDDVIHILRSENYVRFETKLFTLSTELGREDYPAYTVLLDNIKQHTTIGFKPLEHKDLLAKLCAITTTNNNIEVVIDTQTNGILFDGELVGNYYDYSTIKNTKDLRIAFNVRYLLDLAKNSTGLLEVKDAVCPTIVRDYATNTCHMLMPMRIKS